MVDKTQTIKGFEHLFDLEERIGQMQYKEVDAIMREVCEKDSRLQLEREITLIKTRQLDQTHQAKVNAEKVESYMSNTRVLLDSAAVFCHVAAAMLPPGPQQVFTAGANALSKSSDLKDKTMQANQTGLQHVYESINSNIHGQGAEVQQTQKNLERSQSKRDSTAQGTDRLMQSMFS